MRALTERCKHFNGTINDCCDKGVSYDTFRVKGKSLLVTLPCFVQEVECEKREYPTPKEIQLVEIDAQKSIDLVVAIDKAVSLGETSGKIEHDCGGVIEWVRPTGGHMRARCSGCSLSVIE